MTTEIDEKALLKSCIAAYGAAVGTVIFPSALAEVTRKATEWTELRAQRAAAELRRLSQAIKCYVTAAR